MENQPQNPTAPQKTNDLAVASLVLALLGLIFWPLTTIPAIICGHIARSRFRKKIVVSGDGLALAGLIIGYALTALFVILAVQTALFYCKLRPVQWHSDFHAASSAPSFNAQKGTEVYRGELLFQKKGCVNCHMISGIGGTPGIIVESGEPRGPALTNVAERMTSQKMADYIIHGGKNMPAFGEILKPDETKAIVTFLSTLHRPNIQATSSQLSPTP